uniref:Uncharacterized protein n=1 Tax=Daphnia magna TaxID=35525 RepID=A0A0N8CES3_9CRUS
MGRNVEGWLKHCLGYPMQYSAIALELRGSVDSNIEVDGTRPLLTVALLGSKFIPAIPHDTSISLSSVACNCRDWIVNSVCL